MAQTLFKLFFTQRLAALASTESLRAIREGLSRRMLNSSPNAPS